MSNNQGYTEKADVWSFGMVLYEITTNKIPYGYCGDDWAYLMGEICERRQKPPIPNPKAIHPVLLKLMEDCWMFDPQKRPSFDEITKILKDSIGQYERNSET
jgi:serine/threonine protein kinase